MHAASKDTERAKQELEKIRQVDRDAKETHFLAAQIALAEKQPDKAIEELERQVFFKRAGWDWLAT